MSRHYYVHIITLLLADRMRLIDERLYPFRGERNSNEEDDMFMGNCFIDESGYSWMWDDHTKDTINTNCN